MRLLRIVAKVAIVVVVGGELLANGGTKFIHDAYPLDIGKRQALATCAESDPGFVRFLAGDRDACYARLHVG